MKAKKGEPRRIGELEASVSPVISSCQPGAWPTHSEAPPAQLYATSRADG